MNNPLHFSEEGAHFRIADSELEILDDIAQEEHGAKIQELPIGKATGMLRTIIIAGGIDGRIENEAGNVVASSDLDGEEATMAAIGKAYDPYFRHAVMDIGRVTVDVIKKNEIDTFEAEPIFSFEVLSNAYKWAKEVVGYHKEQLYLDNDAQPVMTDELLSTEPERGETALEHQGLWLIRAGSGDHEKRIIVRAPNIS